MKTWSWIQRTTSYYMRNGALHKGREDGKTSRKPSNMYRHGPITIPAEIALDMIKAKYNK